jgi:hypothetical protein
MQKRLAHSPHLPNPKNSLGCVKKGGLIPA